MSRRTRVYRLDELQDGATFAWTDSGQSETGVILYPGDVGMMVRLHRGRGWLIQEWPAATLVRLVRAPAWQEDE